MKGMLEQAKAINKKGDAFISRHGIKNFHLEASELLNKSKLVTTFNYQEVVESVFSSKTIQNFKNLEFSDLPITISRGKNCFIDLYFWRRRPTVIHNHHFNGAFMCLSGQNLDLEYGFKKTQKLGKFHELGELKLIKTRKLHPGDVSAIAYLDKFIHQNHHQADLTVNLCFRTAEVFNKNLSNYLFTGLRYEKNPDLITRSLRLRRFLDLTEVDFKKLKINLDDAIHFTLQFYESESMHPRFIKVKHLLNQYIKDNTGLDVPKMISEHDKIFQKLENEYE